MGTTIFMRGWERRWISTEEGAERISKCRFMTLAMSSLGSGSVCEAPIEYLSRHPTTCPLTQESVRLIAKIRASLGKRLHL